MGLSLSWLLALEMEDSVYCSDGENTGGEYDYTDTLERMDSSGGQIPGLGASGEIGKLHAPAAV